jgi:hypothetical protein
LVIIINDKSVSASEIVAKAGFGPKVIVAEVLEKAWCKKPIELMYNAQ